MAASIAVAAVLGIALGWFLTRAAGPPGPPGELTADPFRCSGSCRRLEPSVTLRWSGPTIGGEPNGYIVERDGVPLGAGERTTAATTFVDRDVTFGERYEYRVVAVSSRGPSVASTAIFVRVPKPPITSAQLTGAYDVHLRVRDTQALSSAWGIDRPAVGDTVLDRWTFDPVCSSPLSACPARWEGLEGLLKAGDGWWSGTVEGPEARCGNRTRAAVPTSFRLQVLEAEGAAQAWVVTSFEGTVTITFHCPGFLTSSGSVHARGTRRSAN